MLSTIDDSLVCGATCQNDLYNDGNVFITNRKTRRMKAFSGEILEERWRIQMKACESRTVRIHVTYIDPQDNIHKAVFVLPLNKLRDISNGAYYDYRWCASAEDLMDKVKTLWNIQYYKLQTNDVVNLYTDTGLVVRDER